MLHRACPLLPTLPTVWDSPPLNYLAAMQERLAGYNLQLPARSSPDAHDLNLQLESLQSTCPTDFILPLSFPARATATTHLPLLLNIAL